MAIGMQLTGTRSMVVDAKRSGHNLDTEATRSFKSKMTKIQRTRIQPMAVATQQTDSGPKAEAKHYMREAWWKGKSLKNVRSQQTSSGLMSVLQHTVKRIVGAEHQATICLQATNTQQTDHDLMVVLQRTVMPLLIASWQTNLSPQATSTQRMDYGPETVLQRITRTRVVASPQVVESPVAKNVHPCRPLPPQRGGNTEDSPNKRKVITIFGGSREVGNSRRARDE